MEVLLAVIFILGISYVASVILKTIYQPYAEGKKNRSRRKKKLETAKDFENYSVWNQPNNARQAAYHEYVGHFLMIKSYPGSE